MRSIVLMLALSVAGPVAGAQERGSADTFPFQSQLAPPQPHTISANELHKPPSLRRVQIALTRSGLANVATSVSLIWDASGHVTHLKLDQPTGSTQLDKAILGWAATLQLNATEPGEGTLPMRMSAD